MSLSISRSEATAAQRSSAQTTRTRQRKKHPYAEPPPLEPKNSKKFAARTGTIFELEVARGLVGPAFFHSFLLQELGKLLKTWVSRTCETFAQSLKRPKPLRRAGFFSGNGAGTVAKLPIQKGWFCKLCLTRDMSSSGTRTELWLGHGCSDHRMLLEHERNMVWAWMLWSSYALGTGTSLRFGHGCSDHRMLLEWFGHGCSDHRMLLEQERYYGLGMDALVIVCSWNTNGIMVWACMLWSSYALGTGTLLWFGHGCSGHRMLCGRLHMAATGFPCAPTLEPHQLQRNLVGTTERRVHEAASHQKHNLKKITLDKMNRRNFEDVSSGSAIF